MNSINNINSINSIDPHIEKYRDSYINIYNKHTRQFLMFETSDITDTPRFVHSMMNMDGYDLKFMLKKKDSNFYLKVYDKYFCIDKLSEEECFIYFQKYTDKYNDNKDMYNIKNRSGDCLNLTKTINPSCSNPESKDNLFSIQFHHQSNIINNNNYSCPVFSTQTEYIKGKEETLSDIVKKYPELKKKKRARNWFRGMMKLPQRPRFKGFRKFKRPGMPKRRWPSLFCKS